MARLVRPGAGFKTSSALGATLLLGACAAGDGSACPAHGAPQTRLEFYMGLALANGAEVEAAAWQDFLDREVTPRFPAGLTVLDGYGQWRNPEGLQLRERSKVLVIVAPPGPATLQAAQAVADAYKTRFHQRSVGMVATPSCAAF